MKAIASLALLLFSVGAAYAAQTVYVDDKLILTLRSSNGDSYEVLKAMPSGTKLELIESVGEYAHVRTEEGEVGWVMSQYLSEEPTADRLLADAQQQLEQLQSSNRNLKQRLESVTSARDKLQDNLRSVSAENRELQKDMAELQAAAAAPLKLKEENAALKTRIRVLEKENGSLDDENGTLRKRTKRDWFLAGAGVLGGGIILGLLLPRLRRRRSTFGDF